MKSKIVKIIRMFLYTLFFVCISLFLIGITDVGNKTKPKNAIGKMIQINNDSIRIYQKGKGKDILLIHGTPGCIEDWVVLIDSLSKKYRVTAFDRLGHGYSTCKNYNYHITDNVVFVDSLINKLKLKKPTIIGHSYGGSIAVALSINDKNPKSKYIVIDSPLFDYKTKSAFRLLSMPIIGKGVSIIANYTFVPHMIKSGLINSFENKSSNDLNKIISSRLEIWSQPKVIYSKAAESVNYDSDLAKQSFKYQNIKSNLTIVTGTDSSKTFMKQSIKFNRIVSNSKLIRFNNTGHYIFVERKNDVLKIIRDTQL